MKRRILVFCLALSALGLTAFGVINWKDSEKNIKTVATTVEVAMNMPVSGPANEAIFKGFIYDVGPRFGPIKKTKLDNAKTIADFLEPEVVASIVSLESVNVVLFENEEQTDILELGSSATLTEAQLQLLQSFDYSTSFVIRADFQKRSGPTGIPQRDYRSQHLTIVPERQTEYSYGKEALMTYLRKNSEAVRADVDPKTFQPAKLSFLVTKQGVIEVIGLDRSSGYPEVDKKIIELISNTPGSWKPAKNAAGENVDQQLVVSFGLMGC